MYSLTIHFGPNALQWQFLFKEKERLESYLTIFEMKVAFIDIADDFGQKANIRMDTVHGWLVEDIDLMEEARIQRSLADARAQAKLQQRARTDTVIRSAQTGAPVLTPMGGFRQ